MHTLKEWKAKRAGGRITVYGKNVDTGADEKIVGVDVIQPGALMCAVATDKNGVDHRLVIG